MQVRNLTQLDPGSVNEHLSIRALAEQIESVTRRAAQRIGELVINEGLCSSDAVQSNSLDMYMPVSAPFQEMWVTDRPDKIYATDPLYTVTSSLALETPIKQEDVLLWAPIDHSIDEIRTHRGIGLGVFSEFMEQLGIKLGRKDYFLWFGSQVDGEQFKLEDDVARKGPDADKEVLSVFFNVSGVEEFISSKSRDLHLHPQLTKLIRSICHGQNNAYVQDAESRKYIDTLLESMHKNMGVRDGWFSALEAILKHGERPQLPEDFDIVKFESELIESAKSSLPIPKPSQAVVLEINPHKVFERIPLYVFPLSARPPDTIVPVPMLPAGAVTAIYTESPLEVDRRFQALQKPLGVLAITKWLADASGKHINPVLARSINSDPNAPLCAARYTYPPVVTWAEHIAQGDIAPWWQNISATDLIDASDVGQQSLRQLVLAKARESGITERLTRVAANEELAEELILEQLAGHITLPSVKSLVGLEGAMLYKR